ncbi:MAG TPA: low molecular weight protein arginine phosphatase [Firmicutes bacterium]|jgi:protein-tyrosine phosphatase|nr:low molecular weight protein arginine phosphatase [Bacillota bacterium]HAA34892.1 low molecular weight protein arginine phosphatase [Bacillota bacterium]
MADTLKILFVCTGNTCRSVMAQGLFEKMWNDLPDNKMAVKAYSAGVAAIDGLSASQEALEILRSEGVDLSGHCSQRVTNELIEKADYIFTMTQGHKETLLNLYPGAKEKVWHLLEYAGINGSGIADPYSLGQETYRMVAEQIKEALQKIIVLLKNKSPSVDEV